MTRQLSESLPPFANKAFSASVPALLILAAAALAGQVTSAPSTQPASQPVGVLIIEGQVVNHIGAGVGGAEVTVYSGRSGGRDELGRVRTDDMGDFKLHGTKPVHGTLIVVFDKTGFKSHEIEVESIAGEMPPFVDYQLEGALVLSGVVRDSLKEAPVAGARVTARTAASERFSVSDKSGRFELADLLPGATRITVEAEGFAQWSEAREIAERGEALNVRLAPERIVRLTVADDESHPVAGVVVESLVSASNDYRTGLTDAEGNWVLRGLSITAARLEVRLSHPQYVSSKGFDQTLELPSDRSESSHTLTLAPAGAIVGKITSALDQKSLGGGRLIVGDDLDEPDTVAYSEFDGTYAITGVPPGDAVVTVYLGEYAPQLFIVPVKARGRATLNIVLSPSVQASGQVLDPEGKPVAGAYVEVSEWRGRQTLGLKALTDETGRYSIRDAPPETFTVTVHRDGFRPLTGQQLQGGKTDQVLKFVEAGAETSPVIGAGPNVGEDAPPFEVVTLEGQKIRLDDLKGKWVLVDFWATWCGPCVMETPNLIAVHKEFAGRKDFELIGVSLDMDEKALRRFVHQRQIAWVQVFGEKAGATRTAERFGVTGIPMTYLIGPDGKVAASGLRGAAISDELRTRLNKKP